MSQYSSRIHIKVSSPDVWRKFEDEDDASFDLASLADTDRTSFIIDGDWSCYERELEGIVNALSETLGKDGIIIADCTNINVDPYDYCIYYFGDEVYSTEFSVLDYYDSGDEEDEDYDDHNPGMMFFNTDISNIPGWLDYGDFDLTDEEIEQLFRCGINLGTDGSFSEFSIDINIPEKVYLRETSFEKRPDIIEKSFVTEEVYFIEAPTSYDKSRLEVMSNLGSLGYLPSDVADQIYSLFDKNRLTYTAQIVELVRPSQRNKHSRSSIVGIHIDAELSKEEVPHKTSVPKIDRNALAKAELQQTELLQQNKREAEIEKGKLLRLEEERLAKEKAETEARRKAEEAQRAEQERKRKAEEERVAKEKAEAEAKRKAEKERLRKEEAKRKAEEKKRKEREETEAAERKKREEIANYKSEKTRIVELRGSILKKSVSEEERRLKEKATKEYDTIKNENEERIAKLTSEISQLNAELSSLGLFAFGKKRELKNQIRSYEADIKTSQEKIKEAEIARDTEVAGIKVKIDEYKVQKEKEIIRDNPLPKVPKSMILTPDIIYDYMTKEYGTSYTIDDLYQVFKKDYEDLTKEELVSIVAKMRNNVLVSREVVRGKVYFTAI